MIKKNARVKLFKSKSRDRLNTATSTPAATAQIIAYFLTCLLGHKSFSCLAIKLKVSAVYIVAVILYVLSERECTQLIEEK